MPIPKDKLNKIFSDPEFLELGDSEKESLLSAIEASEQTIATQKPEVSATKQNGLISGLNTTGRILSGAFQRQVKEGISSDTLTGGPGQQFGQNVKREVLGMTIPGDDLITSSFREALTQGTYPGNIILGGMASSSMASTRLGKLASGIKNSSRDIKTLEKEIAGLSKLPSESIINRGTGQGLKVLKDVRTKLVGQETEASKKAVESITNEFKQQNASIQNRLKQATSLEASDYKGAIKSTFRKVNDKYGEGISSAEDAMIKRGDSISKEEYFERVINKTIQDAQARGIPEDDVALKQVRTLSDKLQEGISSQETLGINEAKNIKNDIYNKLSGGVKRGTSPLSENHDQISNIFLRNHAELLGKKSPELSQLNSEVAPMYEARRWAYSKFKPYRPMEIEKGASILEKIATGGKVNADDVNYLRVLEKGSGRFQGTGVLRKSSSEIGKDINMTAKTFNESKQRLIDASDYRIKQIEDDINADMAKVKSGGQDQLANTKEAETKKIELEFKMKDLEKLRKIKWALISLGAGSVIFGGRGVVNTAKTIFEQ